ncbi:MAG: S49 family peptidase [Planctomycetota bacterium]
MVADPTTITGSIGVVGGKLVTADMWDKLGIRWHPFQRGQNADLFSSREDFRDAQRRLMHDWMQDVYDTFTEHVAEGRNDKLTKSIDEIAGGRVYTGAQAYELGLVDELGGLQVAVARAAARAGLEDYETRVIPPPKDFLTLLVERSSGRGTRPTDLSLGLAGWSATPGVAYTSQWLALLNTIDPPRAAALREAMKSVHLIGRDRIALVIPYAIVTPAP